MEKNNPRADHLLCLNTPDNEGQEKTWCTIRDDLKYLLILNPLLLWDPHFLQDQCLKCLQDKDKWCPHPWCSPQDPPWDIHMTLTWWCDPLFLPNKDQTHKTPKLRKKKMQVPKTLNPHFRCRFLLHISWEWGILIFHSHIFLKIQISFEDRLLI